MVMLYNENLPTHGGAAAALMLRPWLLAVLPPLLVVLPLLAVAVDTAGAAAAVARPIRATARPIGAATTRSGAATVRGGAAAARCGAAIACSGAAIACSGADRAVAVSPTQVKGAGQDMPAVRRLSLTTDSAARTCIRPQDDASNLTGQIAPLASKPPQCSKK